MSFHTPPPRPTQSTRQTEYVRQYLDLQQFYESTYDPLDYRRKAALKKKREKRNRAQEDRKTMAEVNTILADEITLRPAEPPAPCDVPDDEQERVLAVQATREKVTAHAGQASLAVAGLLQAVLSEGAALEPMELLGAAQALNDALNGLAGDITDTIALVDGTEGSSVVLGEVVTAAQSLVDSARVAALARDAGSVEATSLQDMLDAAAQLGQSMMGLVGVANPSVDLSASPLVKDLLDAAAAVGEALDAMLGELGAVGGAGLAPEAVRALQGDVETLASVVELSAAAIEEDTVGDELKGLAAAASAKLAALQGGLDPSAAGLGSLLAAAQSLSGALDDLMGKVDAAAHPPDTSIELEEACDRVDAKTKAVIEMVKKAPKASKLQGRLRALVNETVALGRLADLQAEGIAQIDLKNDLLAVAAALSESIKDLMVQFNKLAENTADPALQVR